MKDIYSTECPKCDAAINLSLADLDGLEDEIENEVEGARQDGYDDGHTDGPTEGYNEAKAEAPETDNRTTEMRLDLYRAIYAGDIEKAEDAMNLMAMVDIDRAEIEQARGMGHGR